LKGQAPESLEERPFMWVKRASRRELGHRVDAMTSLAVTARDQITNLQSKRDVLHKALRGAPNTSRGIYP
jgi:hypothetical protein